jgi:hypothetical protein
MHTHKSITIPVPAKAERKRNELFMEEKRFVEFARALRLQCDQGFLETYERRKVLFPCARVVWPRRLEERKYLHHISNDMRPFLMLTKSKEYRPYLEFTEIQSLISSGFVFLSPSHSALIDAITKEGHPISRSLRGELTPGVVQRPEEKPFRAWKNWQFAYSGGVHLSRAQHYYGWWQVLVVYELEFINLEIENPAWRIQDTDIGKRSLKAGRWCFLHRHVNPPRRIDFNPSNAPLEEIWPGAWSAWLPWIERAADFDWRSYISLQCYLSQAELRGGSDCEWDLHLQREQDAAKNLTEGTCTEEWVRLLRALCRFEEHLAKEERILLRLVVHNLMRMIADLLYVAFNMNTRELALEHDGAARQDNEGGLCSVDGEAVRPWHLLRVLNERFFITDTVVERFVKDHFEQLQYRLVAKLEPDCANSFMSSLSNVYNEPIFLALASYEHARSQEQVDAWKNQQLWAAIRALVVASESETRSWFGKDKLYDVFDELFPGKDELFPEKWQELWKKFTKKHPAAAKGQPDSTKKFIEVLEGLMETVDKDIEKPIQRLDWHFTITYFARNWNAHNGQNPHPYSASLGSLIVTSVMRVLLISWEVARTEIKHKQNLATMYTAFAER